MPTRVDKKPSTTKRMIWMIVGVLLLIALIAGIKVLLVVRMIHGMPKPAPFTVSTTTAKEQPWQPSLSAVGPLPPARGAELAEGGGGPGHGGRRGRRGGQAGGRWGCTRRARPPATTSRATTRGTDGGGGASSPGTS